MSDGTTDRIFTPVEAADYLRLARQTLYNMVSQGEIPFLKAGRALRFRKSELDAWLESSAAKAK
jgi:excisionase family DNA binding protein